MAAAQPVGLEMDGPEILACGHAMCTSLSVGKDSYCTWSNGDRNWKKR